MSRFPTSRVTRRQFALLGGLALGASAWRPLGAIGAVPVTPDIEVAATITLRDTKQNKDLLLRVAYPVAGRALPVVLFSHGAYSSREYYAPLTDPWAAHGHVVISPTHLDSTTLGVKRTDPPNAAWWPSRLADMHTIVDRLDEIVARIPGLGDRVDGARIAAAGHSFGGMVAQTIGGATYLDEASQQAISSAIARVRAVIIVSGAGLLPPLTRESDWLPLTVPALVTVGTNDLAQAGFSGYEWRRQPYDFAPAGGKYLLTLDGCDHYLGGTVGRDDLPRDPRGARYLAATSAVSAAFLRAWLRDDEAAKRWLAEQAKRAQLAMEPLAHLAMK